MLRVHSKELCPRNLMPRGMEQQVGGNPHQLSAKGAGVQVPRGGCWGPPLALGLLTRAAAGATAQALGHPVPELGVHAVLAGGTHGV